jgi:hypothetical protein
MRNKSFTRVLALDFHPRSFGYVVVEDPGRLLDWGVRSYRYKGNSADWLIRKGLRPLFELWTPSVVVVRESHRIRTQGNRLLKKITTALKHQGASVRIIKKRPLERAEKLTKYERSRETVTRFPVLARTLPPKRKPWESEDYRMRIFAAAVLALVYLS